MELYLMPTLESIQETLDYDFIDEENIDALLFQQGYDMDRVEVEDGDTFKIPEGMIGRVSAEDGAYYIQVETMDGDFEKGPIREDLDAGKYKLDGDLIKIIELY